MLGSDFQFSLGRFGEFVIISRYPALKKTSQEAKKGKAPTVQRSAALLVSCAPRWRESLFPVARLAYRWLRVLVTVIRREGATLGRFPRA